MKKSRTILTKHLIAGFLVMLFLFIHVVKLTHHHDLKQQIAKGCITGSKVSNSSDCQVCDYHFIKDSDNEIASQHFLPAVISLQSYVAHISQPTTSIGLHSSDRGPPSLV